MSVEVNKKLFFQRLKVLYESWKVSLQDGPDGIFQAVDMLAICLGKADEDKGYQKSAIMQLWLFGFEFPDTLILMTRTKLGILTSQKKAAILQGIKDESKAKGIPIEIVVKGKEDPSSAKIKELISVLKDSMTGKKLGVVQKDQYEGELFKDWSDIMKDRFEVVDAAPIFADVLAVKDEASLTDIKMACDITSAFLRRHVVEKMETIIDEETKITHSKFTEEIDAFLADARCLKKIKAPPEASSDLVDWAYSPIIQSGGKYDLRPSAVSNDSLLHFGTIICSLGTRYNGYCSNVARTYLISPSKHQEEAYKLLLEVQQTVMNSLRDGTKLQQVYNAALKKIASKKPELQQNFTKNCGFGIGLEFKESSLLIGPKNEEVVRAGMVFNIVVGFQDLENPGATDPKNKTYALLLADTVEVTRSDCRALTDSKKSLDDISYTLNDDEKPEEPEPKKESLSSSDKKPEKKPEKAKIEEKEKDSKDKGKSKATEVPESGSRRGGVVVDSRTRGEDQQMSKEQQRREKQKALYAKKMKDAQERYSSGSGKKAVAQATTKKAESYRKASDMPIETRSGQVYVDVKRESVILPVYGYAVPFHISMIKNPSYTAPASAAGDAYLRLNFVTPGRGQKEQVNTDIEADTSFIGEITYRSQDAKLLEDTMKSIKDLKKISQERDQKRKEQEDLVEQPKLIEGKQGVLPGVLIRPTLESKRVPGTLIIHKNGLRYQSNTGKRLDIVFSNIKHLIFQPCDKEVLVIIHIHLRNPIMLDKKKTLDIQFYREVVDATFDETGNRRRANLMDRDEIESEDIERKQRKLQNKEFKTFAREIADKSDGLVEVDEPFRDLGFFGVPSRSNVFMQPTAFCLVHLTEPPYFVVTMEEVELVYFERIEHGLKNFDMVFIFKDYKKTPAHINTIPMQQLENIKDWLDESEIPYAEGKTNLAWAGIMKHVNEDVGEFFKEGGWDFLFPESDAEEEEEEESGSDFEADSESSESDSESDFSESDDGSTSEESDIQTPSESEGEEWSDLEDKAAKSDKKRGHGDDDDDDRPKKKKK